MNRHGVLRPNAVALYRFLSYLMHRAWPNGSHAGKKVLDCGCGGVLPPLSVFAAHGFRCSGIDVSPGQLEKARAFFSDSDKAADLRTGDMRNLPFPRESFHCVYEHYSMCHLNASDTAGAVNEMLRVLRSGGYLFFGVISRDSWPLCLFGREVRPGEFSGSEEGELHGIMEDADAFRLASRGKLISSWKDSMTLAAPAKETSLEKWMEMRDEGFPVDSWKKLYPERVRFFKYVHRYFIIQKV